MSNTLQYILTLNGNQFNAGFRTAQAGVGRFVSSSKSQVAELTRSFNGFYQQLNGFSAASRLASGYLGFQGLRSSLSDMAALEKAMLSVKANIMSGTGSAQELQQQLKEVRATARELSSATMFSDADSVNMVNNLLKSGVSLKDVKGQNGAAFATAALAQLGEIAPETAASQIGSLGNAFSFQSPKQYRELADQIIRVDDASAMKSSDILYNSQLVSASAAQLKIDPKRMVAALGYLDPLGNMAGTSLNRFLEGLAGTTKGKRKALKASGMDFWQKNADGTETLKDFGTVLETVRNKFRSMKSDRERMALGHQLFGEEGGRAAAFFASKDTSFNDFEQKIAKSAGATDKLKVSMEGFSASFSRLKNTLFSKVEQTANFPVVTKGVNAVTAGIEGGHLTEMLVGIAGIGIAGRLGWKAWKNRGQGTGADGLPGLPGGAQPVFVTNWPGVPNSGMPNAGEPGGGAASGKAGKFSRFGSGIKGSLKFGAPVALAMGALDAYDTYGNNQLTADQKKQEYKRAAAGTTGSIAGAAIGGGIGALFGGFGAVPGAMIGGAIGNALGEWMVKNDAAANKKPIVVETNLHLDGQVVAKAVNEINGRQAIRQ